MSLRAQLLVVGLLTLALPWAGYRYVQELEGALRAGLEQSLIASANTMASALELQPLSENAPTQLASVDTAIYAFPLASAPVLDGERGDWISSGTAPRSIGPAARYWTGTFERTVYVYISVIDEELIYQSAPTETPYGDRLLLLPGSAPDDWLLIHRSGPGIVRSQRARAPLFAPTNVFEDRVTGYWRETAIGYDVELRLPIDVVGGRLGIAVIDVNNGPAPETGYTVELFRSWEATEDTGEFVSRPEDLKTIADPFVQPGQRMRIIDAAGWVVFDGGEIDPFANAFAPSSLTLAERFFRLILSRNDTPYQELENPPGHVSNETLRLALQGEVVAAWYTRGPDASSVIAAAAPIRSGDSIRGGIVLEQGSDSILTLTNEALVQLMSSTLLVSFVVAFGLLGYATRLSLRVRRLAHAADTALSPEGQIRPSLPGGHARDELGDLSRSFSDLLNRLRDYTEYLTTLKGKLAHELRTPLAVVSTSLENLERESNEGHVAPYLSRLREGANRLDSILVAMSEATQIEQAVNDADAEVFGLAAVVSSCVAAYTDVYPERVFTLEFRNIDDSVLGSADLIAQMLDKLVDNAVSFSPEGSTIAIELENEDREIELRVKNSGPSLPESMREQLFDSLVSLRTEQADRRHLGLGLYIVALIVEFHRGRVSASDLPDGSGVCFSIRLPRHLSHAR